MSKDDAKVLAYVPGLMAEALEYCAQRESKFPYFREGYVDVALGRHTNWTHVIHKATENYAIADARGVVQGTYKSLKNAEAARLKDAARPRFATEMELEQEATEQHASASATA